MDCACHGEAAYWQKDKRKTNGGWWECAVTRRQRERDWYDDDPIHRISKNLKRNARRRALNLQRRREAQHGEVQIEGRH